MASTLPLTGNGDITMNSTPADGTIKLTDSASAEGKNLLINGSSAGSGDSDGGSIIVTPGAPTGTGIKGKLEVLGNALIVGDNGFATTDDEAA